MRALIQQLQDTANGGSLRYMIIGPGCSSAAVLIAETAPFYQLTQVRIVTAGFLVNVLRMVWVWYGPVARVQELL